MNVLVQWLNQLAPSWGDFMLQATWQATLVAVLMLGLAALLRRRSSPLRLGLLLVALIKFAVPTMLALPVGICAHLPEPFIDRSAFSAPLSMAPMAAPPQVMRETALSQPEALPQTAVLVSIKPKSGEKPSIQRPGKGHVAPVTSAPALQLAPARLSGLAWLMLAHGLGMMIVIGWLAWQMTALARLMTKAVELREGAAFELFAELGGHLGLRHRPRLMVLEMGISPVAFGVWRPVVLLPRQLLERLEPEQLRAVMGHELAHHRRRDPLVIMLQLLLMVAWWFNPVYWLLLRALRKVREDCCDDLLLARELASCDTYCETLLRTGRELTAAVPAGAALGFAESHHPLARRLRRIMDERLGRAQRLSLIGVACVIALACMLLPGRAATKKEAVRAATLAKSAAPLIGESLHYRVRMPQLPPFTPRGVLSGRIVEESGHPIAGARIRLAPRHTPISEKEQPQVLTDSQGFYHFDKIDKEDEYFVHIRAAGYAAPDVYREYVNLKLSPQSREVKHFALLAACRVALVVVDEKGQPLNRVMLTVASRAEFKGKTLDIEASTGKEGRSLLDGIPPSAAPYVITAIHRDYAPAGVELKLDDPATTTSRKLVLQRGFNVEGRAVCQDGKPATGWEIFAEPDWWYTGYVPARSPVDAQGRFVLHHITAGNYNMSVFIPQKNRDSRSSGSSFVVAAMKLPPTSGTMALNIPRPSPQNTVSISGRVELPPGAELRTMITISARQGDTAVGEGADVLGNQRNFTLSGLPPGVYDLVFYSGQTRHKILQGIKAPSTGLRVPLEFLGAPGLSVRVVDGRTSQPVTTYQVRYSLLRDKQGGYYGSGAPDKWQEVEDAEGRFEAKLNRPGVYKVQALAPGLAPRWSGEYDTDTSRPLMLALMPGATVEGKVVDDQGRPVAGARVFQFSMAEGNQSLEQAAVPEEGPVAVSGGDGRFTLEHATPGRETIKAVHPDFAPAAVRDVALSEGTKMPLTITLVRGGVVEGHVYDEAGKPMARTTLYFQSRWNYPPNDRKWLLATVTTDEAGFYRAEKLPDRMVYIFREDPWKNGGTVMQAVLAAHCQVRTIDFNCAGGLRGRLMQNGRPVAGQSLMIGGESFSSNVFRANATTDGQGRFVFRGVPPGRHGLHAVLDSRRVLTQPLAMFDIAPAKGGEGETLELGDVVMKQRRVVVRIQDDDPGTTAGTYHVFLMRMEGRFFPSGARMGRLENTDEAGRTLTFTELLSGRATAWVQRYDHHMIHAFPFELKEEQTEVTVEARIPRGSATVTGKSTLNRGGGFYPLFVRADRSIIGVPVPQGDRYEMKWLPPGDYMICDAIKPDPVPIQRLTLGAGQRVEMDFTGPEWEKEGKGDLEVTVVTDTGIPIHGTRVWLTGGGGTFPAIYRREEWINLSAAPGEYQLHVAYAGYREAVIPVTIKTVDPDSRQIEMIQVQLSRN